MLETTPASPGRRRVLHFVTGGFSGATQVAVDLSRASLKSDCIESMLVLRRKRHTDMGRVQALRNEGLLVHVVPGWSHTATIWALRRLCLRWRPDVLVAHGFSEHLWGRYAGLLAKVPHLVHVEHNVRERYTRWRMAQARWLADRTAVLVGISEGVRAHLVELGFPGEKTVAIPNGIDLRLYAQAEAIPFDERVRGIVMAARFARQKDHLTLIRAVAMLSRRGLTVPLLLAGGGKPSYREEAKAEVKALGLAGQVSFLGHCDDMPRLLMTHAVCVLSTHYEGMGLALVEGMAAGCACIATSVTGPREIIVHEHSGLLVPENDPVGLAAALERVFLEPGLGARLATAGRQRAQADYDLNVMCQRYQSMLISL